MKTLLMSAAAPDVADTSQWSGDPGNAGRGALHAAGFASTRGAFRFGAKQHPTRTIHAREMIEENGVFTDKVTGIAPEDRADACAADCRM